MLSCVFRVCTLDNRLLHVLVLGFSFNCCVCFVHLIVNVATFVFRGAAIAPRDFAICCLCVFVHWITKSLFGL